jgi:hypothetical protein
MNTPPIEQWIYQESEPPAGERMDQHTLRCHVARQIADAVHSLLMSNAAVDDEVPAHAELIAGRVSVGVMRDEDALEGSPESVPSMASVLAIDGEASYEELHHTFTQTEPVGGVFWTVQVNCRQDVPALWVSCSMDRVTLACLLERTLPAAERVAMIDYASGIEVEGMTVARVPLPGELRRRAASSATRLDALRDVRSGALPRSGGRFCVSSPAKGRDMNRRDRFQLAAALLGIIAALALGYATFALQRSVWQPKYGPPPWPLNRLP